MWINIGGRTVMLLLWRVSSIEQRMKKLNKSFKLLEIQISIYAYQSLTLIMSRINPNPSRPALLTRWIVMMFPIKPQTPRKISTTPIIHPNYEKK